ncbi:hypothetical protein ILUMI_11604 [Ignelater luminosus]|uniref:Uncharacterized protein n=1 Tax=Ignelater luminosus TaxID=2038154 RepID=A0A8K0GCK0_IGNLU|nr:hypothetical protein ILUMI_11604 [Ignelater luminosus]
MLKVFLFQTVTVVPMAAFGIVFGPFLASIGDETSGTTIVNGMFNTILCFTGLAANQLLQKTSYRKVGILGAILYFLGSFSTIFVTSLFQIIISFGILQGIGFGLMMPSVFTAFNHYFNKRKNVTMSVAQAFMVASTIGFPALTRFLLNTYGFRGTVALISAFSLHCIPAMASLQPAKWHMKKRKLSVIEMTNVQTLQNANDEEHKTKEGHKNGIIEGEPLLDHNNIEEGHHQQKRSLEMPRKSLVSMGSIAMSVTNINQLGEVEKSESAGIWKSLAKALDLALFKDPVYVNIAFGLSLAVTSDLAFLSVLPLLLENAGFNGQELTLIMTVYFIADLVCRILLSILTAVTSVRNRYLFLIGALFSAIFRTAFVLNNSFWWVLTVSAALGFLRCLIQTPLPLVVAEAYSHRFVTAFSLYMVVCGFVAMTFGPLIAFVKAVTQSHEMVVHVLTVAYLLCAVPWMLELIYTKIIKKDRSQTT